MIYGFIKTYILRKSATIPYPMVRLTLSKRVVKMDREALSLNMEFLLPPTPTLELSLSKFHVNMNLEAQCLKMEHLLQHSLLVQLSPQKSVKKYTISINNKPEALIQTLQNFGKTWILNWMLNLSSW